MKTKAKTACRDDTEQIIQRALLVFGLRMRVVMDAKQLVPVMGGHAGSWRAVKRGLAHLELAGYVERNPLGPRRFYRRTPLGLELARRILADPDIEIVTIVEGRRHQKQRLRAQLHPAGPSGPDTITLRAAEPHHPKRLPEEKYDR